MPHFKFGELPSISKIAGLINEENTVSETYQRAYGPGDVGYTGEEVPLGYTADGEQIWGIVEYTADVHVSGGWRSATWGYHGGSPPEYPEAEVDNVQAKLVACTDDEGNDVDPPANWKELAMAHFEKFGREHLEQRAYEGLTSDPGEYDPRDPYQEYLDRD